MNFVGPYANNIQQHTEPKIRISAVVQDALNRPLFLLAILYGVAICFERAVEVEILKPYRIVGFLLILGTIATARVRFDRISTLLTIFLGIGFLAGIPGLVDSGGRDDVFLNISLIWIFNLAVYIGVGAAIRSRRDIIVIAIVHAIAMLSAAYGIAQDARAVEFGIARQMGDFKNPANAGVSMLFACLVFLALLARTHGKHTLARIVMTAGSWSIIAFFLYAASLTGSRAGTALIFAGVLYYLLKTSAKKLILTLALAGILGSITYLAADEMVSAPSSDLAEKNILAARMENKGMDTTRVYLWRSGLDAFTDTYGLGVGLGRYPEVHKHYYAPYAHLGDPRWLDSDLTLHSDYVTALVEHGFIGFIAFILLCAALLKAALSIKAKAARAIAVSLLLGMAINGLTHTGLSYFAVWFYFALMTAWRRMEQLEQRLPAEAAKLQRVRSR